MFYVSPDLVVPAVDALVGHTQRGSVALAYVDPGTGSMVLQAALAAALTLPFVLRAKVRAVLGHVSRRRTEPLVIAKSKPALR
jgi:hypothetical protein